MPTYSVNGSTTNWIQTRQSSNRCRCPWQYLSMWYEVVQLQQFCRWRSLCLVCLHQSTSDRLVTTTVLTIMTWILHCQTKLPHRLFRLSHHLHNRRWLWMFNWFWPSHSVCYSWQHRWQYDSSAQFTTAVVCLVLSRTVLISEHIVKIWNQNISKWEVSAGEFECGNRISAAYFLIQCSVL